ncbi:hypothetical protein C4D60_Mb11t05890 [Musa balbisiana]|uniref:Uncharacterized protein n=1 Tax=Musa balbisiana TaxID=52838 RepID=A0A4S8J262_MUSBA|nr:hypothetical protein C4D60_Mb11t05890 [Musa balbisiana]
MGRIKAHKWRDLLQMKITWITRIGLGFREQLGIELGFGQSAVIQGRDRGLVTHHSSPTLFFAPHCCIVAWKDVFATRRRRAAIFGGRSVWAWNLEYEFSNHASLVDRFSYVAFDTEFPGFLYSTRRPHRLLPPSLRYAILKANVDEMDLVNSASPSSTPPATSPTSAPAAGSVRVGVQLPGIRPSDATPTRRTPSTCSAPVASDFDRLPLYGIDSGHFAAHLYRSGLVAHCRFCRPHSTRWIAFHSCYDFAYLIKVLGNGRPLPDTLEEFLGLVNLLFGETVDLKHMMRGCKGLFGGLENVARTPGCHAKLGSRIKLDQIAW